MELCYPLINSIAIEDFIYFHERKDFDKEIELRLITETGFKLIHQELNIDAYCSLYSCVSYHLFGSFEFVKHIRERVSSFLQFNLTKPLSLSLQSILNKYYNGIHVNEYINKIKNGREWEGDFIQLGIISKIYRLPIFLISNNHRSPFGWNISIDGNELINPLWMYYRKNSRFIRLESMPLSKNEIIHLNLIESYFDSLMIYIDELTNLYKKNMLYDPLFMNNISERIKYHKNIYKNESMIKFIVISYSYTLKRYFIDNIILRSFNQLNIQHETKDSIIIKDIYKSNIHVENHSLLKKLNDIILLKSKKSVNNDSSILPNHYKSIPIITISYSDTVNTKIRVIHNKQNEQRKNLLDDDDLRYLNDKWIIYSPNDECIRQSINKIHSFIDHFIEMNSNSFDLSIEIGCPSLLLFPFGSIVLFDENNMKRHYIKKFIDEIMNHRLEIIYLNDKTSNSSLFYTNIIKELPIYFIKRIINFDPSSFNFVFISNEDNESIKINNECINNPIYQRYNETRKIKMYYNDDILLEYCYRNEKKIPNELMNKSAHHFIKNTESIDHGGFINNPSSIEAVMNNKLRKTQNETIGKIIQDLILPFIYLFKTIETKCFNCNILQIHEDILLKESNWSNDINGKINRFIDSKQLNIALYYKDILYINDENMIKCIQNGHINEYILGDLSEILNQFYEELRINVKEWIRVSIYNEIRDQCIVKYHEHKPFIQLIMIMVKNNINNFEFDKFINQKLKDEMIKDIMNKLDKYKELSNAIGNIERVLFHEGIEKMRKLFIDNVKKVIESIKSCISSFIKYDQMNILEKDDLYNLIHNHFESFNNNTIKFIGTLIKNDINHFKHINKKLFNLMRKVINNDYDHKVYDLNPSIKTKIYEFISLFSSFSEIEISFSLANHLFQLIESWNLKNNITFNSLDDISIDSFNDIISSSIISHYLLFETFNMLKLKYKGCKIRDIKSIYRIYSRDQYHNVVTDKQYFEQSIDGLMILDHQNIQSNDNHGVIQHYHQIQIQNNQPQLENVSNLNVYNQFHNNNDNFDTKNNGEILIAHHKIKRLRKRRKFSCSLKDLIHYKYLKIGEEVRAFKQTGIITDSGIFFKNEVFDTPSAFAARCLQEKLSQEQHSPNEMNKITSNYNGWDYVKYNGKKLGYWRTLCEKERDI